jgi:hypothetical protein
MIVANKRAEAQMRDIQYIAEEIKAAKRAIGNGSPGWTELDLAEARLQGLAIFTSLGGRDRDDPITSG